MRFDDVIVDCTTALTSEPTNSSALITRAKAYFHLGDWQAVIRDCDEVLRLDPSHVYALDNRAVARQKIGDIGGGIEDLTAVIRLTAYDRKKQAVAFIARATAYCRVRRWNDALDDSRRSILLDPSRESHCNRVKELARRELGKC